MTTFLPFYSYLKHYFSYFVLNVDEYTYPNFNSNKLMPSCNSVSTIMPYLVNSIPSIVIEYIPSLRSLILIGVSDVALNYLQSKSTNLHFDDLLTSI